ncbi:MAG: tripartite tricarboxylate transporter TctB family protein [Pseudomonadota bacterium]
MKFDDAALGLIVLIAGAAIIFTASGFPEMAGMAYGPAFFPTLIGIGFGLCGVSLLVSGLLAWKREGAVTWLVLPGWFNDRTASMRAIGVLMAVVAYALLSNWLGFLLIVSLITAALLLLFGVSKPLTAVIAIVLPLLLHYGFSVLLRVPLPRGPIEMLLY